MPVTDDLLNVVQVAELMGKSVRATLRRIQLGQIPATKLPGRTGAYVVRRSDAEAARDALLTDDQAVS